MKFTIFTLFIFLTSCAGTKNNNEDTIKDKFNMGIKNLENGKYLQAQSDFKNVLTFSVFSIFSILLIE